MVTAMAHRQRLARPLRALRVVHPLPSTINAVLVASLAIVAGAPGAAIALAIAMLAFQVSIGSLNDIADASDDRTTKPGKPIPAGLVSQRLAAIIVIGGALVGLTISASFGLIVLCLGAIGYGSGIAYDLFMRRLGLGWLCFSVAFPTLLAWTWLAAAGALPPGWPLLLPLAALAGPTVHLANSLVDVEADQRAGLTSLATQLGHQRARQTLAVLVTVVYGLAWGSLFTVTTLSAPVLVVALCATVAAVAGLVLSWQTSQRLREMGWLIGAGGLALMALAWLVAISSDPVLTT